jgi:hypothetical protein
MERIQAAAIALGAVRAADDYDPAIPGTFAAAAAGLTDPEWQWFKRNRHRATIRRAITAGEIDAGDDEDEPADPVPISSVAAAHRLGAAAAHLDPGPARFIRAFCNLTERAVLAAGLQHDPDIADAFLAAFRGACEQDRTRRVAYEQSRRHQDRQQAEKVRDVLSRTVPASHRNSATKAVLAALGLPAACRAAPTAAGQ